MFRPCLISLVCLTVILAGLSAAVADPLVEDTAEAPAAGQQDTAAATNGDDSSKSKDSTASKTADGDKPKPDFHVLLKGARIIDGLLPMYKKNSKLYAEISSANMDKDFIVIISIARGIGEKPLLGGMSWGFGDDWIWQFRKRDDRIQIVRRNVRFRAAEGTPQEEAVHLAYTDSVLFSLPIATVAPSGADVIDITPVFMSDLPQISRYLKGFSFSKDKSSWVTTKGFKDNVELEVAATYASSGTTKIDSVADSRGVTINVHYSVSRLPDTGYVPRMADDRVGFFLSVVKDYSRKVGKDRFVRYVNRWDLQKADPKADKSPPKTPIIIWLEKTVPYKYRAPIRDGILEWNKAFEKIGLVNAIEVRQQPDDADWDAEDINYNTFRWITASAGFAMGPSRVNPKTGQILDSDIIFDADFLQAWKQRYEVYSPKDAAALDGPLGILDNNRAKLLAPHSHCTHGPCCDSAGGLARQLALGAALLNTSREPLSDEKLDDLIAKGLKAVVIHEVGHTLGLRHNFKASTYLTLEELNNPQKSAEVGLAASIMDYLPMNLVPKGQKQGDYFSSTIGPYDYWAIEYGYRPITGDTEAELPELKKIASRCAEPALNYGTDENTRQVDPDPLCTRFDLGKNPVNFARQRAVVISEAMPGLIERMTPEGDAYDRARRAFNVLLSEHGRVMYFAARFVGGVHVHRDHRGDPNGRPPMVVVNRQQQREAMMLLEEHVFGVNAYKFPPELYNHLAPSFWSHWGTTSLARVDYPIHQVVLSWQDHVLGRLLASQTLSRLIDSRLQVPGGTETFTVGELLDRLSGSIFAELDTLAEGEFNSAKPAVGSLRRSLQRRYLLRLSNIALGKTLAPEDCQALAFVELESLESEIKAVLQGKAQLDPDSKAHLIESAARIRKVLEARLQRFGP